MSIFDGIRRLFGGDADPAPGPAAGETPEMITCEQALTFINEFLDGELEGVTRTKVEAHFDVCGRCYPHLKMEEAYRAAVRRAAAGREAPEELRRTVLQLLSEASEEE